MRTREAEAENKRDRESEGARQQEPGPVLPEGTLGGGRFLAGSLFHSAAPPHVTPGKGHDPNIVLSGQPHAPGFAAECCSRSASQWKGPLLQSIHFNL